jgi:hypothetical protein
MENPNDNADVGEVIVSVEDGAVLKGCSKPHASIRRVLTLHGQNKTARHTFQLKKQSICYTPLP